MSIPSSLSIPFTLTRPPHHFRLLELPAELIDLIASSNPPTLQLKSSDFYEGPLSPEERAQSNLHLVTPGKTFIVRQVNTSNELYVVKLTGYLAEIDRTHGEEEHVTAVDLGSTAVSLTAAGQVPSVLELQEVRYCAWELLRKRLSVWGGRDAEVWHGTADKKWVTRESMFADIPLPTNDLQAAWRDLCAVEAGDFDSEECLRPSAVAVRDIWRGILTGCVVNGLDVLSNLDIEQIVEAYDVDSREKQSKAEVAFLRAIMSCLSESHGDGIRLSKTKCLRWTGAKLLQAMTEESDDIGRFEPIAPGRISMERFRSEWMDLLPEVWRNEADVARMGAPGDGRYQVQENVAELNYWYGIGKEEYLFGDLRGTQTTGTNTSTGNTAPTAPGKRKWHEKFKEQRDRKAR